MFSTNVEKINIFQHFSTFRESRFRLARGRGEPGHVIRPVSANFYDHIGRLQTDSAMPWRVRSSIGQVYSDELELLEKSTKINKNQYHLTKTNIPKQRTPGKSTGWQPAQARARYPKCSGVPLTSYPKSGNPNGVARACAEVRLGSIFQITGMLKNVEKC